MSHPSTCLALMAALCLGVSAGAQSSGITLYGITANGDLHTIDRATGATSFVGSSGIATETLSATADGTRLVTARPNGSAFEFFELDPASGAPTLVQTVPTQIQHLNGIAYTSPTRVVCDVLGPIGCAGTACVPHLVAVDLSAGTVGVPFGLLFPAGGGLAYDPLYRNVITLDSAGAFLNNYEAQTFARRGGGIVSGLGNSPSHTVEFESPRRLLIAAERLYSMNPGTSVVTTVGSPFPGGLQFTAIALVVGARTTVNPRLGTPPNPNALQPFRTSPPMLGQVWDPYVDHTTFMPNALIDAAIVGFAPANVPTPYGTLLCPAVGSITLQTNVSWSFLIPVPFDRTLAGLRLYMQGVCVDTATNIRLTNALDAVIGSY